MPHQQPTAPDEQALNHEPQDHGDSQADDFESHFNAFSAGATSTEDESAADQESDQPSKRQDDEDTDSDNGEGQGSDGEQAENSAPEPTARELELQQNLDRLRQSEASQRGRVGAYQRQINELKRQLAQQQGSQEPQQHEQRGQPPAQSTSGESSSEADQKQAIAEHHGSEDWKAFEEDFPEMAGAINARLAEVSRLEERLNQRIAGVEQSVQPIQQQAHDQYLDSQMRALEARHSDWREVVNAPAFQQWLQQQPSWLQQQMESENADDASALLDFYKSQSAGSDSAQGNTAAADAERAKRQQRLAGAVTPQRRGAAKRDAVPEDWEGQFNHFAKQKR
ncbi:hypothetical protein TW86_18085 [Halomonas sp. S2151]|uniref:hypothetical protein n=1 Tax=Halomonas sp. S2151 TaxID=579478 RepID=UPI0005FA5307|nr:hypothetical protein [Halomonas sp. S2151]KJZ07166.1 hypothetical protein TW86_18085 [Halomonas sp. S2151]MBR9770041.1 hypothetical protein [Gammaproteobacteria bacterium]